MTRCLAVRSAIYAAAFISLAMSLVLALPLFGLLEPLHPDLSTIPSGVAALLGLVGLILFLVGQSYDCPARPD